MGGAIYALGTGVSGSGGYNSSAPTYPEFICSSGVDLTKKGRSIQLSSPSTDSSQVDSCGELFGSGYAYVSDNIEPQAYDTLRIFLEQCPFWTNGGSYAWQAFSMINAAVDGWNAGGAGRFPDFLSWLKKVLYYNPDTNWYCNDVVDMISAANNDGAQMAISRYIIQSGKCPEFTSDFQTFYNSASYWNHKFWLDSVATKYSYLDNPNTGPNWVTYNDSISADTLAHPYDSTVPTLWQDSLEILLGPQYAGVQSPSPITSQALLSAQLIENPVIADEIDISYQMGRTALVTMELRDVLGRSVPIANAKYQLESPGPHEASIPAPSLPPGTYYLRLTTDAGDAITLKVVKE